MLGWMWGRGQEEKVHGEFPMAQLLQWDEPATLAGTEQGSQAAGLQSEGLSGQVEFHFPLRDWMDDMLRQKGRYSGQRPAHQEEASL